MQTTTVTEFKQTTLRIGVLTAAGAVSILALGFAPVPDVFYWLGASLLAIILTIATGPKGSNSELSLPIASLLLVPALGTLLTRGTSLIWAVAPVLAFVVGAVTWMVATNRYAALESSERDTAETTEHLTVTVSDAKLEPQGNEREIAATNDDTSAAAA